MVAIQQRAGFQDKALDLYGTGLSMTLFNNESEIFELTEATATTELDPKVDSERDGVRRRGFLTNAGLR
jgi:hypothetical protein